MAVSPSPPTVKRSRPDREIPRYTVYPAPAATPTYIPVIYPSPAGLLQFSLFGLYSAISIHRCRLTRRPKEPVSLFSASRNAPSAVVPRWPVNYRVDVTSSGGLRAAIEIKFETRMKNRAENKCNTCADAAYLAHKWRLLFWLRFSTSIGRRFASIQINVSLVCVYMILMWFDESKA